MRNSKTRKTESDKILLKKRSAFFPKILFNNENGRSLTQG